jgi:hypothetical protein
VWESHFWGAHASSLPAMAFCHRELYVAHVPVGNSLAIKVRFRGTLKPACYTGALPGFPDRRHSGGVHHDHALDTERLVRPARADG